MGVMYPAMLVEQLRALAPHARACEVMLGSTLTVAGPSFAEAFGHRYHCVAPLQTFKELAPAIEWLEAQPPASITNGLQRDVEEWLGMPSPQSLKAVL